MFLSSHRRSRLTQRNPAEAGKEGNSHLGSNQFVQSGNVEFQIETIDPGEAAFNVARQ
jgi:hypothetical protein